LGSLPTGGTLTDVTLNLDLLIGSVTGGVLSGTGTPDLSGNLNGLLVTISAGGVTQTVSGGNLSAYDLFANGFSSALLAGAPLTLSFTASDTVSGSVTGASGGGSDAFGMFGVRGGGFFASSTTTQLSDTRTLTASDLNNYLTLVYTSPNNSNPVIIPLTGPVDPGIGLTDVPEPMSFTLVGAGLGMVAYWRRKKKR